MTTLPTPMSGRLHQDLRQRLEQTEVGTRLPPERTFASELGVSRTTLRRALDELEREGFLARRQGSGTFVARPSPARPRVAQQLLITSFSEEMRRLGLTSTSRILSSTKGLAGARFSKRLQLSPGDPVWTIGRLRLADGEPMALEWMTVPGQLIPGLDVEQLQRRSFYEILDQQYGIRIVGGRQSMEASVTDEDESRVLDVPLHSPALVVERVTWTTDRRFVEYVRSIYRGDRYTFTADLLPPSPEST